MKKLIMILMLTVTAKSYGQMVGSCDCRFLFPLHLEMGLTKELQPTGKFGIWRNVQWHGYDGFVGYRDNNIVMIGGRLPERRVTGSWFFEAGYHSRIAKSWIIHGFAGWDKKEKYLGVEILKQCSNLVALTATYRANSAAVGVFIRIIDVLKKN